MENDRSDFVKKIIVLLGIVCIGFVTVLAQDMLEDNRRIEYEYEKNTICIPEQFKRDLEVNKLLEYCASVDKAKAQEDITYNDSVHGYVSRDGGITQINLYDIENETYKEVVEKIERVLGLEGLVEFAYDESTIEKAKLLLAGTKEEYGALYRMVYYDQAIVTASTTKETNAVGEVEIKCGLYLKMPSEQLKDAQYAALAERLLPEGYYVEQMIIGEEKEILMFVNAAALTYASVGEKYINANGEIEPLDMTKIRYELLADEGKVEEVRMIITTLNQMVLNETDISIFKDAAIEMGLGEKEVSEVMTCIEKTIENPTKDQSYKVGSWQYYSKHTKDKDVYLDNTQYVEIGLTPSK